MQELLNKTRNPELPNAAISRTGGCSIVVANMDNAAAVCGKANHQGAGNHKNYLAREGRPTHF